MKTFKYRYVIIVAFLLLVPLSQLMAQPTFERVNNLQQTLTAAEQQFVSGIENRSTTKSVRLSINSTMYRFERSRFRTDSRGGLNWAGKADGSHREAYLFYHNGYLHGMIHLDSVAYNIEPIDREVVVVTKLDPASFDECPLDKQEDSGKSDRHDGNNYKGKSSSGSMETILSHSVTMNLIGTKRIGKLIQLGSLSRFKLVGFVDKRYYPKNLLLGGSCTPDLDLIPRKRSGKFPVS